MFDKPLEDLTYADALCILANELQIACRSESTSEVRCILASFVVYSEEFQSLKVKLEDKLKT